MEQSPAPHALKTLLPLLLLAAAVLQSGCSTTGSLTDSREPALREAGQANTSDAARYRATADQSESLETSLRTEIDGWLGVPHVYGGMNRRGVDCSGFVFRIYSDLLGVELPRTTEQQKDEGRSVMRTSLRAGDLVFFKPDAKTRHVGIMLNSTEFAHASGSRGVMISEIDEPYWRTRYWLARRVLSETKYSASGPTRTSPGEQVRMSW